MKSLRICEIFVISFAEPKQISLSNKIVQKSLDGLDDF
jgi:hypothetical protein